METANERRWFISGACSTFGRAIAEAALAAGDTVIGTVRDAAEQEALEQLAPGRAFARVVAPNDPARLETMVAAVEHTLGPIDVLVTLACHAHEGALEESDPEDLRRQLDLNVLGIVGAIRAVLPYMRARRRGRIVCVTSVAGLVAYPGLTFYNASKFALEGLLESLGKEVAPLGIRVTAVEAGAFAQVQPGSVQRAMRAIADYDGTVRSALSRLFAGKGAPVGHPAQLGAAVRDIVESPEPPAHLVLGAEALADVRDRLAAMQQELTAWEATSRAVTLN